MKSAGTRRLWRRLEHAAAAAAAKDPATLRFLRSVVVPVFAAKPGEDARIRGVARRNEKTGRQGKCCAECARRCVT
jgi:hypothetical protein